MIKLDAIIYYIIINANNIVGKILSGFGCIQTKILFVFMQALVYFCFSKTDKKKSNFIMNPILTDYDCFADFLNPISVSVLVENS